MFKKITQLSISIMFFILSQTIAFADSNNDLLTAIQKDDTRAVENLLKNNVDPNEIDHLSTLPSRQSSELLFTHNVDPKRFLGLIMTADDGSSATRKDLIGLALEKGASPTALLEMTINRYWEINNERKRFSLPESEEEYYIKLAHDKGADFSDIKVDPSEINKIDIPFEVACPPSEPCSSSFWPWIIGPVAGLAAGAGGMYAYMHHRDQPQTAEESREPAAAARPTQESQMPPPQAGVGVIYPGPGDSGTMVAMPTNQRRLEDMVGREVMPLATLSQTKQVQTPIHQNRLQSMLSRVSQLFRRQPAETTASNQHRMEVTETKIYSDDEHSSSTEEEPIAAAAAPQQGVILAGPTDQQTRIMGTHTRQRSLSSGDKIRRPLTRTGFGRTETPLSSSPNLVATISSPTVKGQQPERVAEPAAEVQQPAITEAAAAPRAGRSFSPSTDQEKIQVRESRTFGTQHTRQRSLSRGIPLPPPLPPAPPKLTAAQKKELKSMAEALKNVDLNVVGYGPAPAGTRMTMKFEHRNPEAYKPLRLLSEQVKLDKGDKEQKESDEKKS